MSLELQSQPKAHEPESGGRQAAAAESAAGPAATSLGSSLLGNALWRAEATAHLTHPTAQRLGSAAVLGLQQTHGNHYVARLLAERRATCPSLVGRVRRTEEATAGRGAPRAVQTDLGPGDPLAGNVRGSMESAFGESFAHVRAHTDGKAASLSAGLDARAFAVGEHVAFGAGEYRPGTPVGDA